MLKKIRVLMDKYAILAAFISFIVIDLVLHASAALLSFLPKTLTVAYLMRALYRLQRVYK